MLRSLFNNIFAVNRSLLASASKFNHCSTICPYRKGVLLAWYSGTNECQNDQSVHVISIEGSQQSEPLRIGDCTGNPVLVPAQEDAVLLWSKFEDNGRLLRLADRWKTCSLWVQKIGVRKGQVRLLGEPKQIAEPHQHLLGRCNPLIHNGTVLLPLYDEVERTCVIFEGQDLTYTEVSRYGTDIIQPTLWHRDGKIGSLARNFTRHQKRSYFCESMDGRSWSEPTTARIWNLNNSIHVLNWNGEEVVLWNDTNGRFRKNLTIGVLKYEKDELGFLRVAAEPIEVVGADHGSYPSMCVDNNGDLNFSFTNSIRQIEYHVWNYKFFRERRDNSARRRASSTKRRSKLKES